MALLITLPLLKLSMSSSLVKTKLKHSLNISVIVSFQPLTFYSNIYCTLDDRQCGISFVVVCSFEKLIISLSTELISEKCFENLPTHMNTNKGSIVRQSGNHVEGCRSENVFQPSMRVFLQYNFVAALLRS